MTGQDTSTVDSPVGLLQVVADPAVGSGAGLRDGGPGESPRQLAVAFDSAPIGMAVTTGAGQLVRANSALGELLGFPPGVLAGRRLEDLADPAEAAELAAVRDRLTAGGLSRQTVHSRLRRADGRSVAVSLTYAWVPGGGVDRDYLVVHVQDATERDAAEAELTRRSLHDALTGLPNRVLLLDRLQRALTGLERRGGSVAVLFADLDGFKTVNDTHGHACGDQVLAAVAHRLALLQRPTDTVCRYGGDEFVVLCEDSGRAQAVSVAARIRAALATPVHCADPCSSDSGGTLSVTLTASVGVAATSDPTCSPQRLLHDADAAMYQAKPRRPDRPG